MAAVALDFYDVAFFRAEGGGNLVQVGLRLGGESGTAFEERQRGGAYLRVLVQVGDGAVEGSRLAICGDGERVGGIGAGGSAS